MMDTVISHHIDIQDLNTSEQMTFIQELNHIATLYPGHEEHSEAQLAIHSKIIESRIQSSVILKHPHSTTLKPKIPDVITIDSFHDHDSMGGVLSSHNI